MTPIIRDMTPEDFAEARYLINYIIELGGTTAYEDHFAPKAFRSEFYDDAVLSLVATAAGRIVGFQVCYDRGNGTFSIGSFADQRDPVKGTGRRLFEETCRRARALGAVQIRAAITADNTPGLRFYGAMGFHDVDLIKNDAKRNGMPIDRVVKVFDL